MIWHAVQRPAWPTKCSGRWRRLGVDEYVTSEVVDENGDAIVSCGGGRPFGLSDKPEDSAFELIDGNALPRASGGPKEGGSAFGSPSSLSGFAEKTGSAFWDATISQAMGEEVRLGHCLKLGK